MLYRSLKCNTFYRGHTTASSFHRRSPEEYFNFIYRSSCSPYLFIDENPTSVSTSSIGRVVCESSSIIQLFLYLLDKN